MNVQLYISNITISSTWEHIFLYMSTFSSTLYMQHIAHCTLHTALFQTVWLPHFVQFQTVHLPLHVHLQTVHLPLHVHLQTILLPLHVHLQTVHLPLHVHLQTVHLWPSLQFYLIPQQAKKNVKIFSLIIKCISLNNGIICVVG